MADIKENVLSVIEGMQESLSSNGFEKVNTGDENVFAFQGNKGTLKVTYDDNKIYLFSADGTFEDTQENGYKRIALSLIESDSTAGDIKYIAGDFSETINEKFKDKTVVRKNNYKAPPTVSKAAVKGGMDYDSNTLVSKICQIYPDLKVYYKDMVAQYGEVLADEFFRLYGNAPIIDTIRRNNPQEMKKLFNTLNEVYDDGSSEVQDIIAVTVLGELNNDSIMLANCVDFMSEIMAPVVININKYLASASGKKARKKIDNPPAYKPKKEKKKGFMARMMDVQGQGLGQ